jgi:hypothetical protein
MMFLCSIPFSSKTSFFTRFRSFTGMRLSLMTFHATSMPSCVSYALHLHSTLMRRGGHSLDTLTRPCKRPRRVAHRAEPECKNKKKVSEYSDLDISLSVRRRLVNFARVRQTGLVSTCAACCHSWGENRGGLAIGTGILLHRIHERSSGRPLRVRLSVDSMQAP